MVADVYWKLDQQRDPPPSSGYLPREDLPDTGGFASDLVAALKSCPQGTSIDVWVQAVSESVPLDSTHEPYSQFLALRQARTSLKNLVKSRNADPFSHTMFGKTITSFAVSEVRSDTRKHQLSAPEDLAPFAVGPLSHCRLDQAMSTMQAASELMRSSWIASVASAVSRKQHSYAWSADKTIAMALSSSDHLDDHGTHQLLKAFTTPPLRSDPSDLLTNQRALAQRGHDLHFPELLRERKIYGAFEARRGTPDQYLLATDVHGLFRGRTRHWPGLATQLLPVVAQFRSSEISFADFIDDAYRTRLAATRRLRETLGRIAAINGLEQAIFGRGDGIFAFTSTLPDILPDLERLARNESQVLPFGVGIVKVTGDLSLRDTLARAEAALCITKLAELGSIERVHYLYGDPVSPGTQRKLDRALKLAAPRQSQTTKLTKEGEATQNYRGLLTTLGSHERATPARVAST